MAARTLFLELALICQVCGKQLFVEALDHGPMKNPEGWVKWVVERATLHQKDGCEGVPNKRKNGGNA